jgi:predicted enzyme related to lactoylglutathione lyase
LGGSTVAALLSFPQFAINPPSTMTDPAGRSEQRLEGAVKLLISGTVRGATTMNIKRVVPDIRSARMEESRNFYVDFLGFTLGMDMGSIMTFVSPNNPTAQITVMRDEGECLPQVSVEVDDVDAMHSKAVKGGLQIVYPLTDEPWGVRRFFVVDPNGTILNVMSHRAEAISK